MINVWAHLISVHIPVIGTPILLIWIISNWKINLEKRWLWIYITLILMGIIVSVSYFSGPSTADWVKNHYGLYNQNLVENHALWGRIVFIIQIFISLLGVMSLSNYLQDEKNSPKIHYLMLILLVINTIIILYTAHLGGLIRRVDLI